MMLGKLPDGLQLSDLQLSDLQLSDLELFTPLINRTIMITTFAATRLPHVPASAEMGDRLPRSTWTDRLQWAAWCLGCVSAVGSLAIATSVQAQQTATSNTLPPPPVTFGTPLQSAPPPAPPAEYDFRAPRPVAPTYAPPPPSFPSYSAPSTYQPGRYMVFVNGNSPMLLDQVKRVEPGAFLRSMNGSTIIQAGRFAQVSNARVRISELESMGIGARIAEVPGESSPGMAPPPSTVAPAAPVGAAPSGLEAPMADGSKGYFVVIPGTEAELSGVASQISQMGLGSGVRQGSNPYGPHIAVGPFGRRDAAESWQRYLRSNGMKNARVFFQR